MPGQSLQIEAADGVADAYLVGPERGSPRAGVLFCIDALGLRPVTMEMADRIAAAGFLVLVPNTLYRGGPPGSIELPDWGDEEQRAAFMAKVRPLLEGAAGEAAARDGAHYLDALAERVPGPVAISGYCMGGRVGWRIAAAYPDRVAALGCFHTNYLVTDAADSPHRSAPDLRAELYFGFADEDPGMSAEQIAELERTLDAAGDSYLAEVYPGALHGYTMEDGPVFDEAARERHFRALFALLDRAFPATI
jgi:carboxymethylenebutenolidase